ncbi:MAG: Ig-like domain-containing protein [Gemmatimonadales bacterium]
MHQVLVFAGFALATACGGGDGSGLPPRTIARFSGAPQTDTVLATLPNPLVVLVRENADPLSGVTVTWTAAGNGKVNGAGTVTTTTGADGQASVTYQLGSTAGTQTPTAALPGAGGSPVGFTLTATAGDPTQLTKTAGDSGIALINSSQVTYTVTARDAYNNPAGAGVTIDWAATGGGGSIDPPQDLTLINGTATATRTLSSAEGPYTATATASDLPGAPSVTFTTTAINAPSAASVSVSNNVFVPSSDTIAVNGAVTWTWVGTVAPGHNVTIGGAGAPANCGNITAAGETCVRTFATAGMFNYSCTNHPGMNGSVTVVQ